MRGLKIKAQQCLASYCTPMSVPFYLSSMGSTDGERGGVGGGGVKQLIMYATHHFSYTIGLGVNDDIYMLFL